MQHLKRFYLVFSSLKAVFTQNVMDTVLNIGNIHRVCKKHLWYILIVIAHPPRFLSILSLRYINEHDN